MRRSRWSGRCSYNSEGQTNRIGRRAEGQYTVIFKGLHRDDFEAQVVAYGDGSIFCGLDGNNNNGWDGYNSNGGGFTITPISAGKYDVRIEGQTAIGANVQVTAISFSPFGNWSNVGSWRQSGSDVVVRVNCWKVEWPTNANFNLRFSTKQSGEVGYAWSNRSTTASYTPSTQYQWQGTTASTTGVHAPRSGTGRYTVAFPDLAGIPSTAMVTAYGSGLTRCAIQGWSSNSVTVGVRCVNGETNQAANSRFTSWARVAPSRPGPILTIPPVFEPVNTRPPIDR